MPPPPPSDPGFAPHIDITLQANPIATPHPPPPTPTHPTHSHLRVKGIQEQFYFYFAGTTK